MWHLAKSELSRFKGMAVVFGSLHLLILGSLVISGRLFSPREEVIMVGLTAYALSGLALGLYQIGAYRKPHLWAYLVHRPLAPGRIFLSLSGAAAMVLIAVVALPLAIATFVADHMTWQWVDARQYLLIPFVFLTVLTFYWIGCFIMLSASRAAGLLLALPFLFLTREAVGLWIFLVQLVVLLWTGLLAYAAFQPNLSAHLRRPFAVAIAALPMQYVLFWVVHFVLLIGYSTQVAFSEHGWKSYALQRWDEYFAEGTYARVLYMRDQQALAHVLRLADSRRADHLLQHIEELPVHALAPRYTTPQIRGQLLFMDRLRVWHDRTSQIDWTFSHDLQRFHGRDQRTGQSVGWLGASEGPSEAPDAAPPFSEIPLFVNERHVVTPRRIYAFGADRRSLEQRFEVATDERLVTQVHEYDGFSMVLSDTALYLFAGSIESAPLYAIPWEGETQNLSRVLVGRSDEGYLVSFILGRQSGRGHHEARQNAILLGRDGRREVVADQPLGPGPPAWSRHRGFIASPLMQTLDDLVLTAIRPYRQSPVFIRDLMAHPPPSSVAAAALVLATISAALTAWCARRRRLDPGRRWAWTAAGFLVGLPGFLSFLLLTPATEPIDDSESETC